MEKAVALLRHLADHPEDRTVGALARGTDLPRPTASRLLRTLEETGLLVRSDVSDGYAFGRLTARLGRAADPRQGLIARGAAVLRELASSTGETSYLTLVLYGTSLHVVACEASSKIVGAAIDRWLGEQLFPMYATSNGKVLLAHLGSERARSVIPSLEPCTPNTITSWEQLTAELAEVRRLGYAITRDELEIGLTSVSAPVRERDGDLTAILSTIGPTFRLDGPACEHAAAELRRCAAEFEDQLA